MNKFILGKKLKMTQIWKGEEVIPVTIVKAEPNEVSFLKTEERDGYKAVQLSLGKKKKEFRLKDKAEADKNVGDKIDVTIFQEGDIVKVSGISKGRGFQGVVKRYNFGGGPATHGQKNRHRAPGSIGSTAPQRVVPGRRMAGRMGSDRISIKNMEVVGVDAVSNTLMLRGGVPGHIGNYLEIRG